MNKSTLGWIAVIFGALTLSFELYMLKFIQMMERHVGIPWKPSAVEYILEPVIFLSLMITLLVTVVGVVLIVQVQK